MHHSLQGLGRAGRQACAMALHQAQGQRGKYLTLELARTRNPVENLCASVSKFQSAKIGVDCSPNRLIAGSEADNPGLGGWIEADNPGPKMGGDCRPGWF